MIERQHLFASAFGQVSFSVAVMRIAMIGVMAAGIGLALGWGWDTLQWPGTKIIVITTTMVAAKIGVGFANGSLARRPLPTILGASAIGVAGGVFLLLLDMLRKV